MIRGVQDPDPEKERVWPFLENFEERSHERWTADGLWQKIKEQKMQLWVIDDYEAVFLTSVGEKCVEIEACAGSDWPKWIDRMDNEMRAWARHLGKSRIISKARPGWYRYAKTRGYKQAHIELVLEL